MGSLTLAKDGNVLYSRAIGYNQINGSQKKPVSEATRYRIGSITKKVHGSDDLSVRRGKQIKADGHPRQILPADSERPENYFAQMLGHRSGIFDLTSASDFRSWKTQPKTQDEMVAIIAKANQHSNRAKKPNIAIPIISFHSDDV